VTLPYTHRSVRSAGSRSPRRYWASWASCCRPWFAAWSRRARSGAASTAAVAWWWRACWSARYGVPGGGVRGVCVNRLAG